MSASPPPSAALVRTARSEIERIDRSMATIEQRRSALVAQLEELDAQVEAYARRRGLLEELMHVDEVRPAAISAIPEVQVTRAIKGVQLREVAGRLLWRTQQDEEIHYREWFERVMAAGYAVGGKDPAASFLTNIRDSPAVRRGSAPGRYRLDPTSVLRIDQEASEVQAELADVERSVDQSYAAGGPAGSLRAHRDDLKHSLKRLEGRMKELRYIFDADKEVLAKSLRAA